MGFQKKRSLEVEKAKKRLSGLLAIEELNLGGALNVEQYRVKIEEVEQSLQTYNTRLSEADAAKNLFAAKEKQLRELSQRMLAGVGVAYGYDSYEYEKAGGTRKSERKKPVRRKITKKDEE